MLSLLLNFLFCLSKYNRTQFLNRKGIFIGSRIEIRCLFVLREDVYGVDIIAPLTPNVCIRFISFILSQENSCLHSSLTFLVSVRSAACPAHPIVDLVILIIFGGTTRIVKLSFNFHRFPVTYPLVYPNFPLTARSDTPSIYDERRIICPLQNRVQCHKNDKVMYIT